MIYYNQNKCLILLINYYLINIISLLCLSKNYYYYRKPFNGGHDIDGKNLFICRINKFGEIIPGKYSENIGKCSIGNNKKEWQFNKFELLIEDNNTRYEWINLKKPVIKLPKNVIYGGRQLSIKNSDDFFNIFLSSSSSNNLYKIDRKRRRSRRDLFDRHQQWSRNWRGYHKQNTYYLRPIIRNKFNFIEILNCSLHQQQHYKHLNQQKSDKTKNLCKKNDYNYNGDNDENQKKLNYFIAKCSLRSGDKFSEQIGKIWWKNSIEEWIASISFAGQEIYCLDYSVLTVKQ